MGIACGFGEGRNHNLLLFGNGGKQIGQGELKDFFPVSLDTSFPTATFSEILQFVQVERGENHEHEQPVARDFPLKIRIGHDFFLLSTPGIREIAGISTFF